MLSTTFYFGVILASLRSIAVESVQFGRVVPESASFDEYAKAYARSYGSLERFERRSLFEARSSRVRQHNARPERLWSAGVNHFTDRTDDELARVKGWRRSGENFAGSAGATSFLSTGVWRNKHASASVDWRNLTVNKEPRDQGECGSCWAFATVTMLQAHNEIRTGSPRSLSAQQLVNCVPNPQECGGSGGCQGATVELAMKWIEKNGLADENDIEYTAAEGSCVTSSSLVETSLRDSGAIAKHSATNSLGLVGWETLPSNKAQPLLSALMAGPVAVSAAATEWFLYDNGIFDSCTKDAIIDHAITMVGFGQDAGTNYFTIQNSWGPTWGENGFIRIFRHETPALDDAYCGVDNRPEDGIACKPYPTKVDVCGMCGILYDSVAPHFTPKSAA